MPESSQSLLTVARSELILGGQKSGKSRRAELLARSWLAANPNHSALLIATAQPWDDEMRSRITRHQADRFERVPGMTTVEEPLAVAKAIADHGHSNAFIVVDCLTLWLTNLLMPASGGDFQQNQPVTLMKQTWMDALLRAIENAPGPIVLVGNEIGLGVIPLGAEVRAFVDALGLLNQAVARACERVTLMAAGLPLTLKSSWEDGQ